MKNQLLKSYILAVSIFLLLLLNHSAVAKVYYLDPVNGSSAGNGSLANPFGSLESVLSDGLIESQIWTVPYSATSELVPQNAGAPIKSGDTLRLLDGYHGAITIRGYVNTNYITVEAVNPYKATLRHIHTLAASKWIFKNLAISPSFDVNYDPLAPRPSHPHLTSLLQNIVYLQAHGWQGPSSDIKVLDNKIFSIEDSDGWGIDDWAQRASTGIFDRMDTKSEISGNTITNVKYGIMVTTDDALVKNNHISHFTYDAIMGNGDDGVYEYNFIANGINAHNRSGSGFTCFPGAQNSTIDNLVIRGNQFHYDKNHPYTSLKNNFRGILCSAYVGALNNFVVDNNLVNVENTYGILLSGANSAMVTNNTVVDGDLATSIAPYTRVKMHHLDGVVGVNVNTVQNNISTIVNDVNTEYYQNINPAVQSYNSLFVDSDAGDFQLKSDSPAINAGSASLFPVIDILKKYRSNHADVGSYEFPE